MIKAGGGSDEHSIKAGEINQTHVGAAFGWNGPDGVVYGRIGAFRQQAGSTTIVLGGVGAATDWSTMHLSPGDDIWFSRFDPMGQMLATVERIETNTK